MKIVQVQREPWDEVEAGSKSRGELTQTSRAPELVIEGLHWRRRPSGGSSQPEGSQ